MTEVVSVKFKSRGKTYYFAPGDIAVADGAQVVVETSKGLELADCVKGNHYVLDERIVPPLRPVVRLATDDDKRIAALCKAREQEAFSICEKKIAQHGLDMKLVDVECNFEGNKILFFFTSDGRVDFRELVKDLAGVFRTRIELRQIGVRDEAKMLGGLGICGRPFCCSQFLDDFQPVSTKMAKTQSLSLNPAKISGTCGRLMCCLRYEQEAYEELVKTVPKNGAFVETPDGYGSVAQVNLLRQKVKVNLDNENGLKSYDADEVAAVPGGRPKPGEPLPHVLQLKAKPAKTEEPEDEQLSWRAPLLFGELEPERPAEQARSGAQEEPDAGEGRKKSGSHRSRRKKNPAAKPENTEAAAKKEQPERTQAKEQPGHAENGGADKAQKGQSHRRPRRKKPSQPGGQGHPETGGGSGEKNRQPRQGRPQGERTQTKPAQKQSEKPAARPQGEKPAAGEGQKKRRRYYGKGKPGGGAPQGDKG